MTPPRLFSYAPHVLLVAELSQLIAKAPVGDPDPFTVHVYRPRRGTRPRTLVLSLNSGGVDSVVYWRASSMLHVLRGPLLITAVDSFGWPFEGMTIQGG